MEEQNEIQNSKTISFLSTANGYKDLFYNPMTQKYKTGTQFDDIISLYLFDESLRELYFRYLCHIEQQMRSLISYHFSETYSQFSTAYLDPQNYNYIPALQKKIDYLINKVLPFEAKINTKHPYILYQRNTYGDVPLWVLMNALTFGRISKMYTYLKTSLQSQVSRHFKAVSEKELGQFLKVLTNFRNVCAHNERLFIFKSNTDIPDKLLHVKLSIPQKGTVYRSGKNDLFAVTISFRYLLPQNEFLEFKRQLTKLIEHYTKKSSVLTESALLNAMGFPSNWKMMARYRL